MTVVRMSQVPMGQLHTHPYVYIGRAGHGEDGYFGNPFPLHQESLRATVLAHFREYAEKRGARDPIYRRRVKNLVGKTLVCFCAPLKCHGDVLEELAIRWTKEDQA